MEEKNIYYNTISGAISAAKSQEDIDKLRDLLDQYSNMLNEEEQAEIEEAISQKESQLQTHVTYNGVRGFYERNKKKALKCGLVLLVGGGAWYGLNSLNIGHQSENGSNEVNPNLVSYDINSNEELENHLAEFRANGLKLGMSKEDLDSENLVGFAYAMNMDLWSSEDIALIDGFNTNKQNIYESFEYTAGILSEDFGSVTKDTRPDLTDIIVSVTERKPVEKRYELMANFNDAMNRKDFESAKKIAADYNKEIENFWATNAHTKVSAQTAAFIARLDKEAKMVTRNLEDGLRIFRDDVFEFAAKGQPLTSCSNVCQIEVNQAEKNGADQTDVNMIIVAHEKLSIALSEMDRKDSEIDAIRLQNRTDDSLKDEDEEITFIQLLSNIETKTDTLIAQNNIQFVANPDRFKFDKLYDATEASKPSYTGPIETAPDGTTHAIKGDNAPTPAAKEEVKKDTEEKLEEENKNAPITPAPGINIDGNGNITTDDGHNVEINPDDGKYDPNIPMWDGTEAKPNDKLEDLGFTPVSDETEKTDASNMVTNDNGDNFYVPNQNPLTPEEEEAIRNQIESEINDWNAQQEVTPISQSINDLEAMKQDLLKSVDQPVAEMSQGGMSK